MHPEDGHIGYFVFKLAAIYNNYCHTDKVAGGKFVFYNVQSIRLFSDTLFHKMARFF